MTDSLFHVPERCRILAGPLGSSPRAGNNGAFFFDSPIAGRRLYAIASDEAGWEHVSVSARQGRKSRMPTWDEMSFVKALFWDSAACVMQLHVPGADHINCHPHTLHLWRPIGAELPRPPAWMVGPQDSTPQAAAPMRASTLATLLGFIAAEELQ